MPTYRIRYGLWQINAASASEAKLQVCTLYRRDPERFITIEETRYSSRRPLWKRLLTGD